MSEVRNYTGQLGRIWVQPDGPNTPVYYLGRHELGPISEPRGAMSRTHVPSRRMRGRRDVASRSQAPGDEITTNVNTLVTKAADYMEGIECPFGLYVMQSECGVPDVFGDYDRGQVLQESVITDVTDDQFVQREEDDNATIGFDLSAYARQRFWKLTLAQLSSTATAQLNDVAFLDIERCAGICGDRQTNCEIGYAVGDAPSGAPSPPMATATRVAWAATATNPFATDEDISSVCVVAMPGGAHRVIVARGSADASNPAEIAYSMDTGANWTNVDLDTADNVYVPHGGGLWMQDTTHIWVCTSAGEIFFSEDQGATWIEQETPVATALNQIKFVDENTGIAVGAANAVLFTENGGDDWVELDGPAGKAAVAINCCHIYDNLRFWLGFNDGELWFTRNGGASWEERELASPPGLDTFDRIDDIEGVDVYNVNVAFTWTDGSADTRGGFCRSIDGGYNWEAYAPDDAFTTNGLMAVWMCDYNNAILVGAPIAGESAIFNVTAA